MGNCEGAPGDLENLEVNTNVVSTNAQIEKNPGIMTLKSQKLHVNYKYLRNHHFDGRNDY